MNFLKIDPPALVNPNFCQAKGLSKTEHNHFEGCFRYVSQPYSWPKPVLVPTSSTPWVA